MASLFLPFPTPSPLFADRFSASLRSLSTTQWLSLDGCDLGTAMMRGVHVLKNFGTCLRNMASCKGLVTIQKTARMPYLVNAKHVSLSSLSSNNDASLHLSGLTPSAAPRSQTLRKNYMRHRQIADLLATIHASSVNNWRLSAVDLSGNDLGELQSVHASGGELFWHASGG